ncbi:hypothetical protein LguiA_000549 [Lonicera macranthoides]
MENLKAVSIHFCFDPCIEIQPATRPSPKTQNTPTHKCNNIFCLFKYLKAKIGKASMAAFLFSLTILVYILHVLVRWDSLASRYSKSTFGFVKKKSQW